VAFVSYILVILAALFAASVALFLVEVIAAVTLPQRRFAPSPGNDVRHCVAVLVPAHDESSGLLPTLADIKAQMRVGDRLVVVADNCSDDTAAVAAAAGAEVVERNDPARRGKGYALARGLDYLRMDAPDIVIVIDADCRLGANAIDRLATTCAATHAPVQALYLMTAPTDSSINFRVAEFAWRVKNCLRPLGLRALYLPCQLMGTGMAFPWDVIVSVDVASRAIVEDLKLGLELALAGNPPMFCPSAAVTSTFPSSLEGARGQRLRWEQGHIGLILTAALRLIFAAITRGNLDLLALALDLAVPPLSLLAALVLVVAGIAAMATVLNFSSTAILISTVSLVGLVVGVFLSWLKVGRDVLPPGMILLVVPYMMGKLVLYGLMLSRKSASQWTRTDRGKPGRKETTSIL
jgi:cellulose synthase/poly-beta-1,6-N-acetylglucosamine synthase-like glycosyltransferase